MQLHSGGIYDTGPGKPPPSVHPTNVHRAHRDPEPKRPSSPTPASGSERLCSASLT